MSYASKVVFRVPRLRLRTPLELSFRRMVTILWVRKNFLNSAATQLSYSCFTLPIKNMIINLEQP